MDPDILRLHDESRPGYNIYLDTEGYAVPNRLIKRDTAEQSEVIMNDSVYIGFRGSWVTSWLIFATNDLSIKYRHGFFLCKVLIIIETVWRIINVPIADTFIFYDKQMNCCNVLVSITTYILFCLKMCLKMYIKTSLFICGRRKFMYMSVTAVTEKCEDLLQANKAVWWLTHWNYVLFIS